MSIIQVSNLIKKYGDFTAVNRINFQVNKGEIFGFLGPNGAGKTTTINMLTGLTRITAGNARIKGIDCNTDIKKVQEIIGIVPDESNLYNELDGFENLCFCASLYGFKKDEREQRARRLLQKFGLENTGKRPFKAYSKGMKRKLTIAAGIIHDPEILFLDEPTTGIDVASARQIRKLIVDLNKAGTTIFLTTHYIEEAERLCDRVAFIVEGRIKHIGEIEKLLNDAQQENILEFSVDKDCLEYKEDILEKFSDYQVEILGNKVRIHTENPAGLKPFIDFFDQINCIVYEARMIRPSLEEVFVKITGIGLDTMKKEKEKGGR